jgi:LysM repeat protein
VVPTEADIPLEGNIVKEAISVPEVAEMLQESDSHYVDVTVKRGDALEKIARANGTTVSAIKKANNLKSEKLTIGQILKIPVNNAKVKVAAKPKTTPKADVGAADAEYYTIKSGDNPWKLAKQFHVDYEDLLKLNNLDEDKAKNLKIGDRIRIK